MWHGRTPKGELYKIAFCTRNHNSRIESTESTHGNGWMSLGDNAAELYLKASQLSFLPESFVAFSSPSK
jgi:hypothetical protein